MTQAVATHELPPQLPPQQPVRSPWSLVRLAIIGAVLTLGLIGLGSRAYYMQVQQRDLYRALAEEQYLKEVELPPHRGRIFDRIGTELAASADVDSIYVNPHQLRAALPADRREDAARRLSQALGLDRREVARKLASDRHFLAQAPRAARGVAPRPRVGAARREHGAGAQALPPEPRPGRCGAGLGGRGCCGPRRGRAGLRSLPAREPHLDRGA